MNETISKLEKQIADLTAQQETALAAAEAEGVSAEDRQKHLDEFDRLQGEKGKAKASLTRASQLARDNADLAAMRSAGAVAIVQQPHNPNPASANRLPAQFRRHGPLRAFRGPDAAERAEAAGHWAAAAIYGSDRSRQWCEANGIALAGSPMATLTSTNNSGAGYFVPDVVEYAIQELALEYGVLRRFAEVVPMGSETLSTPRWTAGMTAYWIAQGSAPTSSDPAWDLVQLVAKDLAAMTKMRRQLDEDSVVDLGDKITVALAEAFTYAEDNAGFNGTGASSYGGITGLLVKAEAEAAAKATAATGHDTIAELDVPDWLAVVAKLANYPGINPRWYVHKTTYFNSMVKLQMATGGITPADLAAGGQPMFLGYPVTLVNAMPSTYAASSICAIFGDLRMSTKVGNRRGRTVERGFENDDFTKQLITILGTQRVDIVNHTVTDPRNSSNSGPIVGLELAS